MAETLYQVVVRNTVGNQVALFSGGGRGVTGGGMQAFSYRKRLRTPGSWWVQIAGDDERIDLIELNTGLNYIFEFWRRDPIGGLGWYRDFSGLHRFDNFRQVAEGRQIYVARGRGLNDLLGGEPIRYDEGSDEAEKSGPAETCAKEYVDENLGSSAPAARQLANFTIQADAATGATWGGDRANEQLFDVLVELADFAPGDFNVVDSSAINATPAFQFRWADNQWGEDRTSGNTDGNAPVIFGVQRRNATNIDYTYSRLDEVNVVYTGGKNFREFRKVRTRTASDVGLDDTWDTTNWARRAVFRSCQDNADSDIDDKADETLYKLRPKTEFRFEVNMSANTRYGRDWDYGDLVTVEHRGRSIDQKIVGVIVAVSGDGSVTITPETEEWYG